LEDTNVWGTLTERDAPIYRDNDFEIFLDIDNDGRWYYEYEMNALNTVYDLVRANKNARLEIEWDIRGIKTAVFVDGTLNFPLDTDRGWYCEIAWPMSSLREYAGTMPVPPREGDEWRIDFPRVELVFDTELVKLQRKPGSRVENWVWSPPLVINNHWIEALGFLRFSNTVAGSQSDTGDAAGLVPVFLKPDESKRKGVKPGSMVRLPGVDFVMGPDPLDPETSPAHTVTVESIFMDRYEVTVAEYAAFLNDVRDEQRYYKHMAHYDCGIVANADGSYSVTPGREEYPVVYVDYEDAEAYAAWAGKRLPTETEWEYACRLSHSGAYPWGGDKPDPARCNFNYHYGRTLPVGSLSGGATKSGIHDMVGNVWEICAGEFTLYPGGNQPYDMDPTTVYRGGSWATPPKMAHASVRELTVQRTPFIGFRCVKDVN